MPITLMLFMMLHTLLPDSLTVVCTARAGLARVAAHATKVLPVGWWSSIVLSGKTVGIIGGGGRI